MANPVERESQDPNSNISPDNKSGYSHRKVFEGVGSLVYTNKNGVLLIPSQAKEPPWFDDPILKGQIGMVELFEGESGSQRYRITIERSPIEDPET